MQFLLTGFDPKTVYAKYFSANIKDQFRALDSPLRPQLFMWGVGTLKFINLEFIFTVYSAYPSFNCNLMGFKPKNAKKGGTILISFFVR